MDSNKFVFIEMVSEALNGLHLIEEFLINYAPDRVDYVKLLENVIYTCVIDELRGVVVPPVNPPVDPPQPPVEPPIEPPVVDPPVEPPVPPLPPVEPPTPPIEPPVPPVEPPPVVEPPTPEVGWHSNLYINNLTRAVNVDLLPTFPDLSLNTYREINPSIPLQTAIVNAASGEKIVLRGGTYRVSNLSVNKPVTIMGYPGEEVILVPTSQNRCMGVTANNVTIANLKIRNFSGDNSFGILMNDGIQNLKVVNTEISDTREAITMWGRGTVTGLLVYNCLIQNFGLIGIQSGGGKAVNWRIENSKLIGTLGGSGSGADAFATEDCNNVLFVNNEVSRATADGVDTKGVNVSVLDCHVHDIARNGIKLWQGGDIVNTKVFRTGADAQIVVENGDLYIDNSIFAYHNYRPDGSYGTSYFMTFGYDGKMNTVEMRNSIFTYAYGSIWMNPNSLILNNNIFWNGRGNGTIINNGNVEITTTGGNGQFTPYGNSIIQMPANL